MDSRLGLGIALLAGLFACGHPIHEQFKDGGTYHRDVSGATAVHTSRILVLPPRAEVFGTTEPGHFRETLLNELTTIDSQHSLAVRSKLYRSFIESGQKYLATRSSATLVELPAELWAKYDALPARFVQLPLDASLFPVLNETELRALGSPEADYVLSFTDAELATVTEWQPGEIGKRTSNASSGAYHAYVVWDPARGRSLGWGFAHADHGSSKIDAEVLGLLAEELAESTLKNKPFVAQGDSDS
jgi:hypothetical protein